METNKSAYILAGCILVTWTLCFVIGFYIGIDTVRVGMDEQGLVFCVPDYAETGWQTTHATPTNKTWEDFQNERQR